MQIQYGSELDPKEPCEFHIHSFTDNNPEQAWRLKQMIVLHDVSEFNKGKWMKRGFITTIICMVQLLMSSQKYLGGCGNGKLENPC